MKINDIIVLLYHIISPKALLFQPAMTLLYALRAFYTRYNKAPLITLLLQTENKGNNVNNHAIKYFLSGVPQQI